ncbi:MAG: sugar O-acetyltransferase [Oscillospiraceae bacterium]|nr:sugar O-acetyltransferase [Oscillospiraceae bacterium]
MTIREKMQQGLPYTDLGEGLEEEREACKELLYDYNLTRPKETEQRTMLLQKMLGQVGKDPWIEMPLHMAYGKNTFIGDNFYANFNLVVVDDEKVYIGSRVMIAPNVTITTTGHPVHPQKRGDGTQFSFSVHIEDDVWIGSNTVILPGVTIGEGSVIGAGSVVTKSIPPNVVAVGAPCRVLRPIEERDKIFYWKDKKFPLE